MPAGVTLRKITISLPSGLVETVERQAARLNLSSSQVIAQALSKVKAEEDRLAAEGYQFYAWEASEFAAASWGQALAVAQEQA